MTATRCALPQSDRGNQPSTRAADARELASLDQPPDGRARDAKHVPRFVDRQELVRAHWDACDRSRTVARLFDHYGDVNRRGTFAGPSHGQGVTAPHIAAWYRHMAVVTLLAERRAPIARRESADLLAARAGA